MSDVVDEASGPADEMVGEREEGTDRSAPPPPDEREVHDNRWIAFLEWFDGVVYWLVGSVFLLAALLSLGYGLFAVGDQAITQVFLPAGFSPQALVKDGLGAQDIIALVSDLLLTLIIMEVLGTVVHHLQDGETTLRPFLFIGVISATRGILAVGARLSVSSNSTLTQEEFIRDMVELAVNALVIIALGIAMKLIGKFLEESALPKRRVRHARGRRRGTEISLPSAPATEVVRAGELGVRTMFVLMVIIILVALALIGTVLSTQGHL